MAGYMWKCFPVEMVTDLGPLALTRPQSSVSEIQCSNPHVTNKCDKKAVFQINLICFVFQNASPCNL